MEAYCYFIISSSEMARGEGQFVKVCGKNLLNKKLQGGPAGEENPGFLCASYVFFSEM